MNGATRIILVIATVLISLIFFSLYASYSAIFSGQALTESTLVDYGKETTLSFSTSAISSNAPSTVILSSGYYHFRADFLGSITGPLPWYIIVPFVSNSSYNLNIATPSSGQNASVLGKPSLIIAKEYFPQSSNDFYRYVVTGYNVSEGSAFNVTAYLFKGEVVIFWIMTEYHGRFYILYPTFVNPQDLSLDNNGNPSLTECLNVYNLTGSGSGYAGSLGNTLLPSGSEIIVPSSYQMPKDIVGPFSWTIPAGSIVLYNGQSIEKLTSPATLQVYQGSTLSQDCQNLSYFPVTTFVDGIGFHDSWIGTQGKNYYLGNTGSQTLSQWVYMLSYYGGEPSVQEICIINSIGSSTSKAVTAVNNQIYTSNYAPVGGYAEWDGNAGLIVGGGEPLYYKKMSSTQSLGNQLGSPYSVAFTLNTSNGWVTIVADKAIAAGTVNLISGVYNATSNKLELFINGTLVSSAVLPSNYELQYYPSYADIGDVYTPNNEEAGKGALTDTIGIQGGTTTNENSQLYAFQGSLATSYIYDVPLTKSQISELFHGYLVDVKNLELLWEPGIGQYTTSGKSQICTPNLVNESQYNGYFGHSSSNQPHATGIPAILWLGGSPVSVNSLSSIAGTNITVTYSGQLYSIKPGETSFLPLLIDPISSPSIPYDNEYLSIYMNNKLVYQGSLINDAQSGPQTFSYYMSSSVFMTISFTFTVNPNANVFLGLQWEVPGTTYYNYIPVTAYDDLI
jgi:hypothetical protein